ncbi:SDR family oxidoreductase [Colwellia sp. TT2012]|uniref:SDR family oxidoreductase n=1 Tax=Colwellia sp. TT2012 TaxID=1720342 RepID=UPI00070BAC1A|nr:SDR family NAD(P)-dependent oxidoreductase [Colwellia sp. TT2012]
MKLINKKILITGATSGIGLKLVEKLYPKNKLFIIARNQNKINELKINFPGVVAFKTDFKNIAELPAVVKQLQLATPSLDVLINNAAVQYTPTFIDSDFKYESINDEITTNFTALCSLCYLLLPMLSHQHNAVILNVNSGLALVPKTSSAIYCASKGALNIFSQSLRYQLKNTQVQVLQAFLPLVDTPMTEGRGKSKMTTEKVSTEIIKGIENTILDHDIGKVKRLRLLNRLLPNLAQAIMRKS